MGHPDWQTYPNWRGVPLIQENAIFPVGFTNRGPFSLNNYQSVLINVVTPPDNMLLFVQFFTDTTLATLVEELSITFGDSVNVNVIFPAVANALRIRIDNNGGAGAILQYAATPVNIPVSRPTFFATKNEVNVVNTAVPASSNAFFQLPFIQPGLAHLWLNPRDASGKLNFLVRSGSPTVVGPPIFVINGPVAFDQRLIGLTDRPYLLEVSNTDGAAAHSFDASLIPVG